MVACSGAGPWCALPYDNPLSPLPFPGRAYLWRGAEKPRPTLELPNLHAAPHPLQPHPYSPSPPPLLRSLPTTITDTHLRDFFGKFGTVTAVQVLKNRESGRSRGFGFVIFVSTRGGACRNGQVWGREGGYTHVLCACGCLRGQF